MNFDYVWRKLSTQSVLRTPYYGVRIDHLKHPQGHELDYYVIEFARQAVGVVPVDEDGRVLLVQQWRHPVEKLTWSLPAGAIEADESPADAAARELREETGYAPLRLEPLYHYHPTIGVADQTFHLFIAHGLREMGQHDANEIHEVRFFTRDEIDGLIAHNEIVDGLSLTGLLMWLRKSASRT
jgi:8-oxo-dGTP pyrophosphatase MutT (NUDIX family)